MRLILVILVSGVLAVTGMVTAIGLGEGSNEPSTPTYVHPGGTDRNGCHICRTNCSRWGLRPGERHCHRPRRNEQAWFNALLVTEQTEGLVLISGHL